MKCNKSVRMKSRVIAGAEGGSSAVKSERPRAGAWLVLGATQSDAFHAGCVRRMLFRFLNSWYSSRFWNGCSNTGGIKHARHRPQTA